MFKNSTKWIQDIKYSPNDQFLVTGSHDWSIFVYDTNGYKILSKITKHSSYITHIDWSLDSNFIHSNCGAYELLFFNAKTG